MDYYVEEAIDILKNVRDNPYGIKDTYHALYRARKRSIDLNDVTRSLNEGLLVGVEKSFLLHSPLVEKVEIVKRAKVRRNNLSYLRERSGKSARLVAKDFDRVAVNTLAPEKEAEKVLKNIDKNDTNKCPKCGGMLVERESKYGKFIGCSNYPKCKYTKNN